jgi:hypothetical protein
MPRGDDRRDAAEALRDLFAFVDAGHWESGADAAAWLAHVLTVAARPVIDGPVPAFVYTAAASGSGKTALALTAGIIGGRGTKDDFVNADFRDDDALSRKLDPFASRPGVVIDNLHTTLRSPLLESAVSSGTKLQVRRLYVGDVRVPLRCVFAMSANGATVGADWARRSLPIRLSSKKLVAGRDLEREAVEREDLTSAAHFALSVWLRALAAGEPSKATPLNGFTDWSTVVAGCLRWALGPDFDIVPATRAGAAELVDEGEDGGALLDAIAKYLATKGTNEASPRELWDSPLLFSHREGFPSLNAFGRRLARLSDSTRVLVSRKSHGERRWSIRSR